jgi:hypothetical protein
MSNTAAFSFEPADCKIGHASSGSAFVGRHGPAQLGAAKCRVIIGLMRHRREDTRPRA